MNQKNFALVAVLIIATPAAVFAHQPRVPVSFPVTADNPEVSKAYYSQLAGKPQEYVIVSDKQFDLYVNIVVPDIAGQKNDVSATIIKENASTPLAVLDGVNSDWKPFFEPFGHDNYRMGPEFEAQAGPGKYTIRVYSTNNDSKYSLAIGKIESFNFAETVNAVSVIPKLKSDFFDKSPADFILSPFGIGYIVAMFGLAFVTGFFYRLAIRMLRGKAAGAQIKPRKRGFKLALAGWLLLVAVLTTWNPVLLFAAGLLCFFAIF